MNYPFKKVITDINNYFFIKKTIKKNENAVDWKKYKLRHDWVGRIYTVINLPPEVIHSPDAPQEIRPAYILEESKPINEYLTTLNLQEIIVPEIRPIPDSISYLVIYSPSFQKLSWRWLIYRSLFVLSLIWAQSKFGFISFIWEYVVKGFDFVF